MSVARRCSRGSDYWHARDYDTATILVEERRGTARRISMAMTWVEVLLLLSVAGIIPGLVRRRTRALRILAWVSLAILAALVATYGPELVSDVM